MPPSLRRVHGRRCDAPGPKVTYNVHINKSVYEGEYVSQRVGGYRE